MRVNVFAAPKCDEGREIQTAGREGIDMPKDKTTAPNWATLMPSMPYIDIESLITANQKGLKATVEMQEHMMRLMARINGELLSFLGRRLDQDRAMAKELTTCKSPQDAVAVCRRFFETAMKQYTEEMGFLSSICAGCQSRSKKGPRTGVKVGHLVGRRAAPDKVVQAVFSGVQFFDFRLWRRRKLLPFISRMWT